MNLQPVFFIIPGFKQKATDKMFSWLVSYLKKKKVNVVAVPIKWKYQVMSDYIKDFNKFYAENKSDINYVLGFSYGAVIAFSSASELLPNKIFLCSLSPDFREDVASMKPWLQKLVGKNRIKDSNSRTAKEIAKEIKVPSVIFYGEKEGKQYPQLKVRAEETTNLVKNSKLVVVPKSPHRIDNPEYVKAIKKELEILFFTAQNRERKLTDGAFPTKSS